jgi:hypothetical protein
MATILARRRAKNAAGENLQPIMQAGD